MMQIESLFELHKSNSIFQSATLVIEIRKKIVWRPNNCLRYGPKFAWADSKNLREVYVG